MTVILEGAHILQHYRWAVVGLGGFQAEAIQAQVVDVSAIEPVGGEVAAEHNGHGVAVIVLRHVLQAGFGGATTNEFEVDVAQGDALDLFVGGAGHDAADAIEAVFVLAPVAADRGADHPADGDARNAALGVVDIGRSVQVVAEAQAYQDGSRFDVVHGDVVDADVVAGATVHGGDVDADDAGVEDRTVADGDIAEAVARLVADADTTGVAGDGAVGHHHIFAEPMAALDADRVVSADHMAVADADIFAAVHIDAVLIEPRRIAVVAQLVHVVVFAAVDGDAVDNHILTQAVNRGPAGGVLDGDITDPYLATAHQVHHSRADGEGGEAVLDLAVVGAAVDDAAAGDGDVHRILGVDDALLGLHGALVGWILGG